MPESGHSPQRTRRRDTWRIGAGVVSAAAHLSVLALLLLVRVAPPVPDEVKPITVGLVDDRPPAPTPLAASPTPSKPTHPKPPPPRSLGRISHAPPLPDALPAGVAVSPVSGDGVSEAELAGAGTADSGPSGRGCDMTRRVQAALRKDPLVQAAVAGVGGKALRVWDGDWVLNQGQDGKGLAAVREAIMWEVGFAPEACKTEPMRGLVLLSMNGAGGSARLVIGQRDWRWGDLLTLHGYQGE
jgi:hypothetical protein